MFFFILIIFIVVVAAIVIGQATAKHTDANWATAASQLRLKFVPSSLMQSRRIEGTLGGHWVLVNTFTRSSGKNSTTFTRYSVNLSRPLELEIRLTRQGFFSPLMTFLGAQDIEVGDAAFDKDVVVKGRDPERIIAYLTPLRRLHIRRLMTTCQQCVIDYEKIERLERSVQRDPEEIVKIVRQLVSVANHMCGEDAEQEGDEPIAEVIPLADADPDAPLRVRAAPPPLPEEATPIEDAVVAPALPWSDFKTSVPSFESPPPSPWQPTPTLSPAEPAAAPLESLAVPTVAALQAAEAATAPLQAETPTAADPAVDMSIESVCGELFDPRHMSFQVSTIFEQRYQDRPVRWAGTLQRANGYASDLVFGNHPGTKAIFDICELEGNLLGKTIVQAVVQLAPEAEDLLRTRTGERLEFTGRLSRCDSFTRQLFVADGSLLSE